jgi:hypothetical protein
MRRRSFSARAFPASRSSSDGDLLAPPSFSHLAIDLARSERSGALFMPDSRVMQVASRSAARRAP